ncbi:MAG: bacillithiol system redox-active protein YtxJ [Gemmatimonadaceae bacterium]|nr:bacillithiol system redox-active protein YtxJ [Gemmatimonadaceae bacterium]
MPIQPLVAASVDELAAMPGTTVVYKHSPTCSLSWVAAQEVARLVREDDVTVHQVDVFAQRAMADAIESHFHVRHESPQILILEGGQVVWHVSHRAVTAARIRAALAGQREGVGARF